MNFNKDDYIVLINIPNHLIGKGAYLNNHVYKQREANICLRTYLDSLHSLSNGWNIIECINMTNWRYATIEEKELYDKANEPIDVTTLIKKPIMSNYNYLLPLLKTIR